MRVVVDTNIVVSAFLFSGLPAQIFGAAAEGRIVLISSEEIIAELGETLSKPKFARVFAATGRTPAQLIEQFRAVVELAQPADGITGVVRDEDDDMILACAVGAEAAHIVTGDKDLLDLAAYRGISILTVSRFLALLD